MGHGPPNSGGRPSGTCCAPTVSAAGRRCWSHPMAARAPGSRCSAARPSRRTTRGSIWTCMWPTPPSSRPRWPGWSRSAPSGSPGTAIPTTPTSWSWPTRTATASASSTCPTNKNKRPRPPHRVEPPGGGGEPRRLADPVHPVHVAACDPERLVVLAHALLVRRVQQAVDLAVGVVVQLSLVDSELVGGAFPRFLGDLRDGFVRQLQVVVEVHEARHVVVPSVD